MWIDQRTDGGKPSDIEIPEALKECLVHDDREGFLEKYTSFMGWAVENHLLDYNTMKNILQDILQMFFCIYGAASYTCPPHVSSEF